MWSPSFATDASLAYRILFQGAFDTARMFKSGHIEWPLFCPNRMARTNLPEWVLGVSIKSRRPIIPQEPPVPIKSGARPPAEEEEEDFKSFRPPRFERIPRESIVKTLNRRPNWECREMRGFLLTDPEFSPRAAAAATAIGGRNCHRKHVEDG
ncbi:hypothetical protein NL676_036330 [Syzygium grande]|nr:hypothetical protein NL676_036330 [Syzygium grande]